MLIREYMLMNLYVAKHPWDVEAMQAELLIHITVSLSSSMSGDTGQPSLKVNATIGSDLEVHVLPRTYQL